MLQVAYQETRESVTFSTRDLANRTEDGKRPLYVIAFLGASQIKRALVNTNASTNIPPPPTLDALSIPRERIIREPLQMVGIGSLQQYTLRHVSLDFKVGPIRARTLMHVMNGDTLYHVILGYPWLNALKLVASTYHQCVKTIWKGRLVTIKAIRMPYDRAELHYAEAALYQKFEPKGKNRILPFNATV